MSMKSATVGFVGLGIMGDGMSRCILNQCPNTILNVWNRSPEKTDKLKAEFGNRVNVKATPAQAVSTSDLTFLMLSTPEACEAVYTADDGVLAGVSDGKMLVDCATLRPDDMISYRNQVSARGGTFLEAPVSGSKGPAETGTLIFLASGDEPVFKAATPYLEAMGKASYYLGAPGEGTKMKLVVNGLMANMLAALGESFSLARETGVPEDALLEVLSQGAMANPMFALKGPNMIKGGDDAYPANFPLKHALKDLAFSMDNLTARESSGAMGISAAARTYYEKALAQDKGELDFAAVVDTIRRQV